MLFLEQSHSMKNKKTKADYITQAEDRILKYLKRTHIASNAMIVHQLAELSSQKINPHITTEALHKLLKEGVIYKKEKPFPNQMKIPCYIYKVSKILKQKLVERRMNQIYPYLDRLKNNKNSTHNKLHKQLGYALEIPVFERLNQLAIDNHYELQGKFENYTANDYSKAKKTEPLKQINNIDIKIKGKKVVDFVLETDKDTLIIECKNIRQWIYPNNLGFKDFLQKAIDTDTIPVFIARRQHFTINIFRLSGLITHDTYNQTYPFQEYEFASQMRDKDIIGFHDIAIIGHQDERLESFNERLDNFIFNDLLPTARKLFDLAKPSLQQWINNEITLAQLYQIVKKNSKPTNKINKPIEDNIDFVNQFKMNKTYADYKE